MISFVENVKGDKRSFGVVLNKYYEQLSDLFQTHGEDRIVFYDLVNDCIVRNAIIEPEYLATVRYCKLPDNLKPLFKKYVDMISSEILETLAKIRSEYGINASCAEFLLIAFNIVNGDQEAISAHQIWRKQTLDVKRELINARQLDATLDLEKLERDQIPYLGEVELGKLIETGFFIELNRTTFKINKEKFYNEIFINKHIAYQQLTNTFKDVSITIRDTNYKVCNITDRQKAVNDYWDSIGGLISRHKKVLEACNYAIETNQITNGLTKIIANEEYNDWITTLKDVTDVDFEEETTILDDNESNINIVV